MKSTFQANANMTAPRLTLLDLDPETLGDLLEQAGHARFHARQIYRWIWQNRVSDFALMSDLSAPLRRWLNEHAVVFKSQVASNARATDETLKLLLRWGDGTSSEVVMIPDQSRRTICVSTQIGCPVRCTFCASGVDGLERNMTTGQIVEQLHQVNTQLESDERISNIVFMGMGEPLANYDATLAAARLFNAPWAGNIAARKITISTVGLPSRIRQLATERLQVTLAISLHAPDDVLRARLIPWAQRVKIEQLMAAARSYFQTTGREVTFEYILLEGVNNRPGHAARLIELCRGQRCNVNLISYNPVEELPFDRPSPRSALQFLQQLRRGGVNAHLRPSRGVDIAAACGQLRQQQKQGNQ